MLSFRHILRLIAVILSYIFVMGTHPNIAIASDQQLTPKKLPMVICNHDFLPGDAWEIAGPYSGPVKKIVLKTDTRIVAANYSREGNLLQYEMSYNDKHKKQLTKYDILGRPVHQTEIWPSRFDKPTTFSFNYDDYFKSFTWTNGSGTLNSAGLIEYYTDKYVSAKAYHQYNAQELPTEFIYVLPGGPFKLEWAYDDKGRVLSCKSSFSFWGDTSSYKISTWIFSYNSDDHLAEINVEEYNSEALGSRSSTIKVEADYDKHDNWTKLTKYTDRGQEILTQDIEYYD